MPTHRAPDPDGRQVLTSDARGVRRWDAATGKALAAVDLKLPASLGNPTIFLKHVFYMNRDTGSVATGGFAISPETAPGRFGGAPFLRPSNTTTLQPFFGYFLNFYRLYVQGFSAIDVPIVCAGVDVMPGDLVVGDADGIVVVPRQIEDVVLENALKRVDGEHKTREALLRGAALRDVFAEYNVL